MVDDGKKRLYKYSYNAAYDVYVVKGIDYGFDPSIMEYVPSDLLRMFVDEYSLNHPTKRLQQQISFSKNGHYAVVDFNGRSFDEQEIKQIVGPDIPAYVLVEPPKEEASQKVKLPSRRGFFKK